MDALEKFYDGMIGPDERLREWADKAVFFAGLKKHAEVEEDLPLAENSAGPKSNAEVVQPEAASAGVVKLAGVKATAAKRVAVALAPYAAQAAVVLGTGAAMAMVAPTTYDKKKTLKSSLKSAKHDAKIFAKALPEIIGATMLVDHITKMAMSATARRIGMGALKGGLIGGAAGTVAAVATATAPQSALVGPKSKVVKNNFKNIPLWALTGAVAGGGYRATGETPRIIRSALKSTATKLRNQADKLKRNTGPMKGPGWHTPPSNLYTPRGKRPITTTGKRVETRPDHLLKSKEKTAYRIKPGDRPSIPRSDFAQPRKEEAGHKGKYPIPDRAHARSALGFSQMHGDAAALAAVRAKIRVKFPDMLEKKAGLRGVAEAIKMSLPQSSNIHSALTMGMAGIGGGLAYNRFHGRENLNGRSKAEVEAEKKLTDLKSSGSDESKLGLPGKLSNRMTEAGPGIAKAFREHPVGATLGGAILGGTTAGGIAKALGAVGTVIKNYKNVKG